MNSTFFILLICSTCLACLLFLGGLRLLNKFKEIRDKKHSGEWISVKDKLPDDKLVIIYSPVIVSIGYLHKGQSWYLWLGGGEHDKTVNVTHWMPLPEKPKK